MANKKRDSNKKPKQSSNAASIKKKDISGNWMRFMKAKNYELNSIFKVKDDLVVASTQSPPKVKKSTQKAMVNQKNCKIVALDCEMVSDENGEDMLARVSIVDFKLNCIYDKYVKPTGPVGDYRTRVSGIRPEDLQDEAKDFSIVQQEVRALLWNKILVGHSLRNDFHALKIGHHRKLIRDTSLYKPYREIGDGKSPALKKLAKHFLNETIQEKEHDSVEDARTAMKLYIHVRHEWEKSLTSRLNKEEIPNSKPLDSLS